MGWGKGKGHHHHHGHWGPGPAVVAAEIAGAAVVGGIAGAALATAVAPRPKPHPRPPAVVVVEADPVPQAPVAVVAAQPQAPVVVVAEPAPRWKGKGKGYWKGKGKGKGKSFAPVVVIEQTLQTFASVSVPSEGVEMRGDTHYFAIDVIPEESGNPWRVMRRYNEFHELYSKIGQQAYPDAPFPKKHLFGLTLNMEDRRRGLEVWLQRTIQHPKSRSAWARPLANFLTAGKVESVAPAASMARMATSAAVAAPAAAPLEPAPVAASAPPAEPAPEEGDGSEVVSIEIPPGVASGATLGITMSDGKQVNFTLPEGKNSGDYLELWYDASAGTLTPFSEEVARL